MKKYSLLFAFVLLLASCSENNLITPDPDSLEGVHSSIGLSVAPMQGDAVSKGSTVFTKSQTGDYENVIKSLWVLQFSNDGMTLLKKSYILVDDVNNVDILLANTNNATCKIYFVANAPKSAFATISTEGAYKAAKATFTSELGIVTGFDGVTKCIPMSGELLNQTVTDAGLSNVVVPLVRMLARIDVKCTLGTAADLIFMLRTVRLGNALKSVNYYPTTTPTTPAAQDLFDFEIEAASASATYTFYVPENLRGNGTNTGADAIAKNKSGKEGATYIELGGIGRGRLCNSLVNIKCYPGDNAINNYDIKRNNKYTTDINLTTILLSDLRVSTKPTSNCYIVAPTKSVEIPIARANQSDLGIQIPDVLNSGCIASVYWAAGPAITAADPNVNNLIVRVENGGACTNGIFTVTGVSQGNAVVVLTKTSGAISSTNPILWSWHIWVSTVDFTSSANTITTNNGTASYVWMDRNLGALEVAGTTNATFKTTGGMFYQWGRKDPFWPAVTAPSAGPPAVAASPMPIVGGQNILDSYTAVGAGAIGLVSGETYLKRVPLTPSTAPFTFDKQLALSVNAPGLFLTDWSGSVATAATANPPISATGKDSWNGDTQGLGKSVYDPCPLGWRVPSSTKNSFVWFSPWSTIATPVACTALPSTGATDGKSLFFPLSLIANGSYCDWSYGGSSVVNYGKYPTLGTRNTAGQLAYAGTYGYCWSGSVNLSNALALTFSSTSANPIANLNRATGAPVRCVLE